MILHDACEKKLILRILWKAMVLGTLFFPCVAMAESSAFGQPIVVGSKNFTENRILAEIMAQLLEEKTDIPVRRRINLGGTKVVFSALLNKQIDLYPEYTGTAWTVLLKINRHMTDPLRVYVQVKSRFKKDFGLLWLKPFGFNNSYALAMSLDSAQKLGVAKISDLKPHAEQLRVGVNHEFLNREDGYIGLAKAYGLQFKNLRGVEHGLAYEAIRTGKLDLIDTWTTDGKLLRYPIRVLEDDRHFFPPYDAAPIIRAKVLERYPEVGELLGRLAFKLSDNKMQKLNLAVEEGRSFAQVARDFLKDERLVDSGPKKEVATANRKDGFFSFMWSRQRITLKLLLQHLYLTVFAVLLAILVAVPVGILLTRWQMVAHPVINAIGTIQTIPSLALLAFMIPLPGLGLGARSAIVALFLYALLPIVRNTYTGLKEVDPDLIEAALGMGLSRRQILFKIQLPLAIRMIMAGIRTSTVISIGVATLAAFIGAGGLGDPIVTGLQLNETNLILSGAIPAALLAVLADFILGRLEAALVPRGIA